ncbi:hypothetical protein [Streptomyces sp. M92]|uniref:hypothetical protein n=1 Tax=Streptomyces sp. M92 TaxID=2944250 RepID=UPI00234B6CE2|nr:hypothetical protein [Streptomyces sp. M92]WCN04305.1 hypothetical protein M6G08_20550 [Streptomyces sp. M92]
MSNKAGKSDSGSSQRDEAKQTKRHESTDGSVRSLGEARAAKKRPWRHADSGIPEFTPGTLDAAAILKSVNETLLPVVDMELEEAARSLVAALDGKETDAELVSAFRSELMRRVLPQFTEAVRKGVLEGMHTRQMHLAQMAVLHRQALEAKNLTAALRRIDHEVAKAGLRIVSETEDLSLFNVVEDEPTVVEREPVAFELMVPAYVDKESGKLVERGWLRTVAEAPIQKPRKMTPGQKRRANHAEAGRQSQRDAPAKPERKKHHRGQDPDKQQRDTAAPTGESRTRAEDSGGRRMKQRGTR